MNAGIRALIHQYHGHIYATAGIICAFFIDAHEANDCAEQIKTLVDGLQVLGSQLTFLG